MAALPIFRNRLPAPLAEGRKGCVSLVGRIVKRAEDAKAAGQPVRKDDTPEVFQVRLQEYYKNTAPLIGYYWAKGDLVQIDGMAEMQAVADEIAKVLDKA